MLVETRVPKSLHSLLLIFLISFVCSTGVAAQGVPLPPLSTRPRVDLAIPAAPPHQIALAISRNAPLPDISFEDEGRCWPDSFIPDAQHLAPAVFATDQPDAMKALDLPDQARGSDDPISGLDPAMRGPTETRGHNWSKTTLQSLFFLGIMHSWRLGIEPDTRAALTGPFFKDYWNAVRQLRGWSDGDNFLTNYIGHPMMGAIAGRIWIQNDPKSLALEPGLNSAYVKSRLKAFGYSTLFSLQFEVGLISEGSIGNATPNQYSRHPFSYIDLAVTPLVGTAWMIGEDLLDRHLLRYLERKTTNVYLRSIFRSFLTPTRAFSNMLRLKSPWYRDERPL